MTTQTALWYDVIDGTWPAARKFREGRWVFRQGNGGGSRVSATTRISYGEAATSDEIAQAEQTMREMMQPCIFMIRENEKELDAALDARGYVIKDPVNIYACTAEHLMDRPIPRVTVFSIWEPLAIMREIWASGGIGAARLAIMQRAHGPKTTLLCRRNDKPAGCAYVAIHEGVAMVHAVEIMAHQRRSGAGSWAMRAAAFWAKENGAHSLSVMCTKQNAPANALYTSLGMECVGEYHYRNLPDGVDPR